MATYVPKEYIGSKTLIRVTIDMENINHQLHYREVGTHDHM
jgi:hypothetical protein